jgi:hypothetical protein
LFFPEQTVEAIIRAVERFEKQQIYFQNRQAIRQTTFRFHPDVFRRKITALVAQAARRRGIDFQSEITAPVREFDETRLVREPVACLA